MINNAQLNRNNFERERLLSERGNSALCSELFSSPLPCSFEIDNDNLMKLIFSTLRCSLAFLLLRILYLFPDFPFTKLEIC